MAAKNAIQPMSRMITAVTSQGRAGGRQSCQADESDGDSVLVVKDEWALAFM